MSDDKKKKVQFLDANYPKYIQVRAVREGDLQGKIELNRTGIDDSDEDTPRRGIFKPMHESFKKRKSKVSYRYANHYGEYIGYRIAEKIGIPACKVDMAKRRHVNKYSRKTSDIEGCISYIHKEARDTVISGMSILEEYRRDVLEPQGIKTYSSSNNNIDIILSAVEWNLTKKSNLPNHRINEILKSIVEVVVFDCAFGNSDRSDENWGILHRSNEEDKNKSIELYPIYDNERILGFMEREDVVRRLITDEREVSRYHNEELLSRIGYPPKNEKANYRDMINYLLDKYPEWARSGIDKVLKFKEKDLDEILDECDELEDSYKQFSKMIFRERTENIRQCLNEYYLRQGIQEFNERKGHNHYDGEEL